MEICCINSTLWGADIDVRGTIYTISTSGRVDVSDAHAEILLQSNAWQLVDASQVAERSAGWSRAVCRSLPLRDLIDVARMSGISVAQSQDAIFLELIATLKDESVPDTFKRLDQYKKDKDKDKDKAPAAPPVASAPAAPAAPALAPVPAPSSK